MALSGTEWGLLHQLKSEHSQLKYKDPEKHWDMNNKDIAIVREWMKRRIDELEAKKAKDRRDA